MIDAPSGGAPEQAPRWDLTGTEGCGGGNRVLVVYGVSRVHGYIQEEEVHRWSNEGPTRVEGAPRGGRRAPLPRALLVDVLM